MKSSAHRIRIPRHAQTLAVFGGTFDPIHLAHLILAEELLDQAVAEHVLFVPAGNPPHKARKSIGEARHRLAMVRLAIRGNARFSASSIELERGGSSYTVDTLRMLREGMRREVRIALVVGADQVQEFETWKDYRTLAEEFQLILTTRAGYADDLREGRPYLRSAAVVRIPELEISATDIRRRVAEGRSIHYLVPEAVRKYIDTNGLYR